MPCDERVGACEMTIVTKFVDKVDDYQFVRIIFHRSTSLPEARLYTDNSVRGCLRGHIIVDDVILLPKRN